MRLSTFFPILFHHHIVVLNWNALSSSSDVKEQSIHLFNDWFCTLISYRHIGFISSSWKKRLNKFFIISFSSSFLLFPFYIFSWQMKSFKHRFSLFTSNSSVVVCMLKLLLILNNHMCLVVSEWERFLPSKLFSSQILSVKREILENIYFPHTQTIHNYNEED